jgi:hypothetical protein
MRSTRSQCKSGSIALKVWASATLIPPAISGKPHLGFLAVGRLERRPRRQIIEHRLQFDLLIDPAEFVDALLKPLGDRQAMRLDDVAAIGRCRRLRTQQQAMDLIADEVTVAPQARFIDVETRGQTEEPLEFGDRHHCHGSISSTNWLIVFAAAPDHASPRWPIADRERQYVAGLNPGTLTAISFARSEVSRVSGKLDLSSIDCVSLIWIKSGHLNI